MRKLGILIAFCGLAASVFGQFVSHTMPFGGQTRQYSIYVPAIYTPANPVPLVFGLHGLGDNIANFSGTGFNYFADTANFITILPQALVDPLVGGSAWNSGASAFGITLNGNVDDVGFINALIDSISANYNIDSNRVYACGFSLGGFMSQRLACQLNNRIAAIASVAGTIGSNLSCQPGRAVPVLHFHGTADGTISYTANNFGMSTEPMMQFWVGNNACTATPDTIHMPDIANDGYTVDHFEWSGCDQNYGVEFFKVFGADHVWLGSGNDISYTREIWRFFNKYRHPNAATAVSEQVETQSVAVFPNPNAGNFALQIELKQASKVNWTLTDLQGRLLKSGSFNGFAGQNEVDFSLDAAPGMYILRGEGKQANFTQRIILQ